MSWRPILACAHHAVAPLHSVCRREVYRTSAAAQVPWQALCCLTPDATQLAAAAWAPHEPAHTAARPAAHAQWLSAAARARAGDIAPLRLMAVDVVCATGDGQDRSGTASCCAMCHAAARLHADDPRARMPDRPGGGPQACAACCMTSLSVDCCGAACTSGSRSPRLRQCTSG